MSAEPILSLEDSEVFYNNSFVLSTGNLIIRRGEKLAVVGQSGAGKSTLLRLLYEKHVGQTTLVPQHDGLVETLSVFHNVYMGRLANLPAWYNLLNLIRPFKKRVNEVQAILQQLSLSDKCFETVASLSGGQRQRTSVARSMYQGGQVLLADEPVSAIDERQAELVLNLLSNHFSTMVVALHDTQLALNCCDRIIGLKTGKIVMDSASVNLSEKDLAELYIG